MKMLLRLVINAAAIWVAVQLLSDLEVVAGDGDTGTVVLVYLGLGLLFGVVNAIVKPIVKLIAFPLYLLTLGLFTLVVNALMLMLTAWLSEQTDLGLRVDGFWAALFGALIISIVSFVLSVVTGARDD